MVFEPGEILLDRRAIPREIAFAVAAVIARLRGGAVVLPPRAIVGNSRASLAAHRLHCRFASRVYWRDQVSFRKIGVGTVVPDIAFGCDIRDGLPWDDRETLVVSLRGDRPSPSAAWFTAVDAWSKSNGLRVVTVAQVVEDEDRAMSIANQLGAVHYRWTDTPDVHEERVRELYGSARMVISDRLHVLVLASLGGAVPTEMVTGPRQKVRSHFAQIGLEGISLDLSETSTAEATEFLSAQLLRRSEVRARVREAHDEIRDLKTSVERLFVA
ncbi:polysaccharide pyruvyl transferase family protein [Cellulomonas sp. KH9]|uniref:polysaccharide pyruvyl transferase family protein n=1 Tax=Cellulomonas sp. KH9 TaxID=1855324 RepID=UPI0015A5CFF8|nr:polysaccharide pyruvyl transferase family protein [Cellulomonas sp. KH9]